jgi:hypothetical protein
MLKLKNFLSSIAFTIFLFAAMMNAQTGSIKYIMSVDYPIGGKAKYLDWVKTVVNTLQSPEEIVAIASYDNGLSTSPHRFIEYEFANAMDAAKYWDRLEIREVLEAAVNYGTHFDTKIFIKRSDYNPKMEKRGKIKYCYMLDYPVNGKAEYISWVKTIVKDLQSAEGINRITSYDNYLPASPQRIIEFEFDSMEDANKYFSNPVVKAVFDRSASMSFNSKLNVMSLRSDYNKN